MGLNGKIEKNRKVHRNEPLLWLINVNATFTLHLHGVVTKLLIQVVGSASPRFARWQCHLDTGCFGTLCLSSEHRKEETVI